MIIKPGDILIYRTVKEHGIYIVSKNYLFDSGQELVSLHILFENFINVYSGNKQSSVDISEEMIKIWLDNGEMTLI